MAKTSYITANGMMLGEVTNGVMRNYGTDALGSVVATYSNGALENTYAYKPNGGLLAKTGVASDPSFLWNGGSGYRAVNLFVVSYYVRARHHSSLSARWTSADPLWPTQLPYGYLSGNPVVRSDYFGTDPNLGESLCDCCPSSAEFTADFVYPGGFGLISDPGYPQNCRNAWAGYVLSLQVNYNLSLKAPNKRLRSCILLWSETWEISDNKGNYISGLTQGRLPTAIKEASCDFTAQGCPNASCTYPDQPGGCPYTNAGFGVFSPGASYHITIHVTIWGTRSADLAQAECGISTSFEGYFVWGDTPTSIIVHDP